MPSFLIKNLREGKRLGGEIALICAVAFAPALAVALFHPGMPSWDVKVLKKDEVLLSTVLGWKQPVLWIDARSREEYEGNHISGALLLNEDEWDTLLPLLLDAWSPDRVSVVYCDSRQCSSSHQVTRRLRETGIQPVYVLKGGWHSWLKRNKQ